MKNKRARLEALKDAIESVKNSINLISNTKVESKSKNLESINLIQKILKEKDEIIFRLENNNKTVINYLFERHMNFINKILPLNSKRRKFAVKLLRKFLI